MTFTSETTGWAVGAMGLMLWTGDGGQTWRTIRGEHRRAAFLVLSARPSGVPFALLTKLSGDEGYRSAVYLPARRDLGSDAADFASLDLKLSESVADRGRFLRGNELATAAGRAGPRKKFRTPPRRLERPHGKQIRQRLSRRFSEATPHLAAGRGRAR